MEENKKLLDIISNDAGKLVRLNFNLIKMRKDFAPTIGAGSQSAEYDIMGKFYQFVSNKIYNIVEDENEDDYE